MCIWHIVLETWKDANDRVGKIKIGVMLIGILISKYGVDCWSSYFWYINVMSSWSITVTATSLIKISPLYASLRANPSALSISVTLKLQLDDNSTRLLE